ncbi:hypothetical protein [Pararhodobacter sp. SW119]|uniref:hypothetical protein n=1 Tax=Pararhodobacter sp. SW119 TaxID=2780075 RepID=UPI001AE0937D|nr:hypothetical protein [Pararhodobacter sp. SW119]
MDRRNQPVEFWGQGMTYWFRLWQSQIEYSMRFWGAMAERLPHPSAADLAAEAEAMREIRARHAARSTCTTSPARSKSPAQKSQQLH